MKKETGIMVPSLSMRKRNFFENRPNLDMDRNESFFYFLRVGQLGETVHETQALVSKTAEVIFDRAMHLRDKEFRFNFIMVLFNPIACENMISVSASWLTLLIEDVINRKRGSFNRKELCILEVAQLYYEDPKTKEYIIDRFASVPDGYGNNVCEELFNLLSKQKDQASRTGILRNITYMVLEFIDYFMKRSLYFSAEELDHLYNAIYIHTSSVAYYEWRDNPLQPTEKIGDDPKQYINLFLNSEGKDMDYTK